MNSGNIILTLFIISGLTISLYSVTPNLCQIVNSNGLYMLHSTVACIVLLWLTMITHKLNLITQIILLSIGTIMMVPLYVCPHDRNLYPMNVVVLNFFAHTFFISLIAMNLQ